MKKRNYLPGTETTRRRPTPLTFEHLRKWIAVDEKYIDIVNITNLKNINQQLEMSSKLYVSNVINRVIAQLLGAFGEGFVTLEGTEDGELKVKLTAADIAQLVDAALPAGTNLIGKVEIDGLPKTVLREDIVITGAGRTAIIALVPGEQIKIANIMFTVDDEVNITFETHETAMTGVMDFGGTNEPRGMVHSFGDFPLCTVAGEAFNISTVGAGKVNGYVTYYTE